ncbi:hypothetical protein C0J52_07038 [Blattella germanica]|nr:hypothetical protein C0J52_07038 [Blattella germanica]
MGEWSAGQSEYSPLPPEEASARSSSAPPPPRGTIKVGKAEQSASVPDQPLWRRLRPRPTAEDGCRSCNLNVRIRIF